MKKFLAMGVLALLAAAFSQQNASAWINAKFGVGLNWGWQAGGNNLLWGVFRNGQTPAPILPHGPAPGPAFDYGFPPYPTPYNGHANQTPGGFDMQAAPILPANPGPTITNTPATRPQGSSALPYQFDFVPASYPGYFASYPEYAPSTFNSGYYYPVYYQR